jgi:ligand-binding sensor domain-containing protein/signal transduction histidine kinase
MSAEPPLKAPDSFIASLRRRSKMLPSMTRPRKRQLAQGVVFIVAMLLSGRITLARDPALDISQYAHTARTVRGGFSLGNTRDNVPIRLPLIEGKDIRFTHYSTEQGLSQNRVDHMLQDNQGFMWFGTYNGLNRFDGYRFLSYKPEADNPYSIGGVFIYALFQDRSGALWIAVDEELDRFDPVTGRFFHYRANPNDPASLAGHVEHIAQDRDGMLWLATRNGLDRLDPVSGRFTHYRHDPGDPRSLASDDVRYLLEDRQGTLWVATAAGPDAFDPRTGKVIRHYPSSWHPPLDRIYEDRSGTLWLCATRHGGLTSLDPKTGIFTTYIYFDEWPETPGLHECWGILEDQRGMMWLATRPDGVLKFDRRRREFTRYRNDPGNPASLSSDGGESLMEDREGSIWIGTRDQGVDRFSSAPSPFTIYRNEPGNPNSLDQNFAYSVLEDSQGIFWIGTANRLNRLDRKTGRYTFYRHDPANPASIAADRVTAMVEDRAGYLWFATFGGGLNRFDRKTGRFKAYRPEPGNPASLSHDHVLSLLLDHEGVLWAGTEDGLNRMDMRTGRFTVYRFNGPLDSRMYRVLAEDRDGSIWMGTYEQGLQRLDVRTGTITAYKNDPKAGNSLSNNRVNALCIGHSGTLWVGTQNGLNRFDRHTGEFTIFNERDGLPSNAIDGILEDAAGNLWLATENGLSKFDPQAKTFKNYYTDEGLAGNAFIDSNVYFKSAQVEMFSGGHGGITAFYPQRVIDNPYVPPIVLTDFRLFNNPVPVGEKSVLRKSISYTGALTLSHQQSIFSIEFSSLSYANPQRNRYRYMLEPLEKTWNEIGSNQRLVTYTTLPPGRYTFRVQGSSSSGVWNVNGVSVVLTILPPWYQTMWFRVLSGAAFLAMLWALYQLRLQQLAQQFNMRLDERVAERTRIARDLHDTLLQSFQGLVLRFQAARNQLPGRPQDACEALDTALVSADQALAEGRSSIQELRSELLKEVNVEQVLLAIGRELAPSQNSEHGSPPLRVIVEGARRAKQAMIREEIYRIARELLRNAYRHAHARSIEAELRYDDDAFMLIVRDDGKGIDPKVLKDRGRAGHWGLRGVYERAEGIGARLDVWSEAGAGTEVRLTVPGSIAYEKFGDGGRFKLFRKTRIYERRS